MNIDYARSAGVLMHITSLPSPFGIGDLGEGAKEFARNLSLSGATLWQILPLGPTGYGNSPYASRSAFAGNELLIDPIQLHQEGYLTDEDLASYPKADDDHVDFNRIVALKLPLLMKAVKAFLSSGKERKAYSRFKANNEFWLSDYAVFMALYTKHQDARWMRWDEKYTRETLKKYEKDAEVWKVLQYFFLKQWKVLKAYVNALGIKLIGDIPIFIGADSADTWSHLELFKTKTDGTFKAVSGVPPDYFSATGQLWGNPVYDWKVHKETGFDWWIKRIEKQLELTDILRIDHFRGFDSFWEVKSGSKTAEFGHWRKAPGCEFLRLLREKLGHLPIIAEDLGFMTDSVTRLRASNRLPGMKICQFGFTQLENGELNTYDTFLPHNYERDFIAYTGTHDNQTARGWYNSQSDQMKHLVREYLSSPDEEIVWSMIKAVMLSHADVAVIPMQDLLELDDSARMNTPSTCNDVNWSWKMKNGQFSPYVIARFSHLIKISGRNGKPLSPPVSEN